MSRSTNLPDLAKLGIEDVDEDLFASPDSSATAHRPTPASNPPSEKKQHARGSTRYEAEQAREAQLKAELERVREVNRVIEGVTASLTKAKDNMDTVHQTVNNASTLLATWTRILNQTEHNQRLILNPNWQGATRDLDDLENEDLRRQQEAERRAIEEQRKREEAQRKAEEEERRKAVATPTKARGVSRTRSVRGTTGSTRGYTAGQTTRGRGTASTTRGTTGMGRGSGVGRGRGRGTG